MKLFYLAKEKIVGWYHTGPKLHQNDIAINELIRQYCPNSILVIIDAEPRDMGLPTEAYHAVEEVHDVMTSKISKWVLKLSTTNFVCRMELPRARLLNI